MSLDNMAKFIVVPFSTDSIYRCRLVCIICPRDNNSVPHDDNIKKKCFEKHPIYLVD